MSPSLKGSVAAALAPLLRAHRAMAEPLKRLWAHVRLSASIRGGIDPSIVILGPAEVHGTGRISLGRELYLYRDLYLETQGDGRITIGDRSVLSRGVHIVSFAEVHIGAGTMIGEYSSVRDANHRFGGNVIDLRDSGHDAAPVIIGRNVWIGRGSTILPGVTIGNGAVIGANSVVTRSVPPHAVVGGAPAVPLQVRRSA